MFAVGHLALGYLTAKASSKPLKVNINIPLVITLSILPDIDLLLEPILNHGGPTHSVILYLMLAFPAFLLSKKQIIPYVTALISHPLIGDYLTRPNTSPGVQLLFPVNSTWFLAGSQAALQTYIYAELALFTVFLALMTITKDGTTFIKPHKSNMLLAIPIITAFLPVFTRFPMPVPQQLIIPHIILIILLTLPILLDVWHLVRHHRLD